MPTVEQLLQLIGAMHVDSITMQRTIASLQKENEELKAAAVAIPKQ